MNGGIVEVTNCRVQTQENDINTEDMSKEYNCQPSVALSTSPNNVIISITSTSTTNVVVSSTLSKTMKGEF